MPFRADCFKFPRGYASSFGEAQHLRMKSFSVIGKAKPFRTSGGEAALYPINDSFTP
jgi:hypothetical protein